MKIDFSQKLLDLEGKPLPFSSEEDLSLWRCSCASLFALMEGLNGEAKYKNGILAEKLYKKSIVEISAEEITNLKAVIGKVQSAHVVRRAWDLLEQNLPKEEKKNEDDKES